MNEFVIDNIRTVMLEDCMDYMKYGHLVLVTYCKQSEMLLLYLRSGTDSYEAVYKEKASITGIKNIKPNEISLYEFPATPGTYEIL